MTLARYAHHTLQVPAGDGIAFIGDSAHSTSPQLGQGANMALLDAAALAVALANGASSTTRWPSMYGFAAGTCGCIRCFR